jgi:hypothetical protein
MVFFENSVCLRCGAGLGVVAELGDVVTLAEPDAAGAMALLETPPGTAYHRCGNAAMAACNWLVDEAGALCRCCALTRTVPDDALVSDAFADTEAAKRRLVFQLLDLGLLEVEVDPTSEPQPIFDLLSSQHDDVTIGHIDGLITIDVDEADDAARTKIREQLGESYRTMLGHFRHEIGHFYWPLLVEADPRRLSAFRTLFGDDRVSYADALDGHYGGGPSADWAEHFVSAYATMHPWEDWAETFAHYLHIRDTFQTAVEFGLTVEGAEVSDERPPGSFAALLADWLPLTYALNALNRSIGRNDLYPFVIAPEVAAKLGFVHDLVTRRGG